LVHFFVGIGSFTILRLHLKWFCHQSEIITYMLFISDYLLKA